MWLKKLLKQTHNCFWLEGADGGALIVVSLEGVLLQLEKVALRERAERSRQPGHGQQDLCLVGLGAVSQRVDDGVEAIHGDDDHDEAREVAAQDPEEDRDATGDVVGQPGDGVGPADLQGDLQENHLRRN